MVGLRKGFGILGLFAIVTLVAAVASAGLLGTGHSYNDGTRTWEGSNTFTKSVTGGTLAGTVEWAVFTASNFSSLFPGYSPTPGELVYAYQVFNTGTVDISKTEAPLLGGAPGDNVGDFTSNGMSGVLPDTMYILPADVIWDFSVSSNFLPSSQSAGLAFSSIRAPRTEWYIVIDGGGTVNVNNVGGPGTVAIPEPSALVLLTVGGASLGVAALRTRRKAKA